MTDVDLAIALLSAATFINSVGIIVLAFSARTTNNALIKMIELERDKCL